MPPLGAKDAKSFEFVADSAVKANGMSEFRVYLDGTLYKSYPIGKKERNASSTAKSDGDGKTNQVSALKPIPVEKPKPKLKQFVQPDPIKVENISPSPNPVPTVEPTTVPQKGTSSEEKTMKDLEP